MYLILPWFSTPKVRPKRGALLANTQVAEAAATQEGCHHDLNATAAPTLSVPSLAFTNTLLLACRNQDPHH